MKSLLLTLRQPNEAIIKRYRSIAQLLQDGLQDNDIVKGGFLFEEVERVEEGVGIGDEVVSLCVFLRARRLRGEDEWCYYNASTLISYSRSNIEEWEDIQTPLASLGAFFRHSVHSLDEQGISCRKYNSRTIFWTFPAFVDRT